MLLQLCLCTLIKIHLFFYPESLRSELVEGLCMSMYQQKNPGAVALFPPLFTPTLYTFILLCWNWLSLYLSLCPKGSALSCPYHCVSQINGDPAYFHSMYLNNNRHLAILVGTKKIFNQPLAYVSRVSCWFYI